MSRFLRQNGLSVFFLAIFLLALAFQTLAGWQDYNTDQLRHGDERVSYGAYLFSSEFGQALLENWQSEYLQFTLYILATVWLLQRGSPESKELDKTGGRVRSRAEGRRARARTLAIVSESRRPAHARVLKFAGHRDDRDLAWIVVRAVRHGA